jgi:integrase
VAIPGRLELPTYGLGTKMIAHHKTGEARCHRQNYFPKNLRSTNFAFTYHLHLSQRAFLMSSNHKHYRDYRDVRGDGRIVLYRRADTVSLAWSARLKIPGHTGYVVKSSKTSDDFQARRFAEDLFYQLEGRAYRGEAIRPPTFKQVFEQWRASLAVDQAIGASKYIAGNIRRMELWAIPNLGAQFISAIDDKVIAEFMAWRIKTAKKPPATSTLRNERTVLNQIFQFSKSQGHRANVPKIRLPSSRQISRPDIPQAEWNTLIAFLPKYVQRARDKRRRRERIYLQHYILILANSGIRVGEARTLRWRDLSETKTPAGETRVILRVKGKTGEREVVCNAPVAAYLERLRDVREAEVGTLFRDEPIFCHPDGSPIGSYKKGFEQVMAQAGILYAPDGKPRVPYSLRHTYATMRLTEGVSVYHLAVNMGTSVKMIEDFYGKKRVRDPKMAAELTKLSEAPESRFITVDLLRRLEGKHPVGP